MRNSVNREASASLASLRWSSTSLFSFLLITSVDDCIYTTNPRKANANKPVTASKIRPSGASTLPNNKDRDTGAMMACQLMEAKITNATSATSEIKLIILMIFCSFF